MRAKFVVLEIMTVVLMEGKGKMGKKRTPLKEIGRGDQRSMTRQEQDYRERNLQ